MPKQVIQATGHAGNLRLVALFRSCFGAVRVNLGSCGVLSIGAATAQKQRLHRIDDNALLSHGLTDYVAVGIRRGYVSHRTNSLDHSSVPF